MRHEQVSDQQRQKIRRLLDDGQTPKSIAQTVGLSLSSVRRALHSSY